MSNFQEQPAEASEFLFPEPPSNWKQRFFDVSSTALSLEQALQDCHITFDFYLDRREQDPDFETLAARFDQVLDLRVFDLVRRNALTGDLKFLTLYLTKMRSPQTTSPHLREPLAPTKRRASSTTASASAKSDQGSPSPSTSSFDAKVAEAMITAGLAAHDSLHRTTDQSPASRSAITRLLELASDLEAPQILPFSASQTQPAAPPDQTLPNPAPRQPISDDEAYLRSFLPQLMRELQKRADATRNLQAQDALRPPRKETDKHPQPPSSRSRPVDPPHNPLADRSPHFPTPPASPDPYRNGFHPPQSPS